MSAGTGTTGNGSSCFKSKYKEESVRKNVWRDERKKGRLRTALLLMTTIIATIESKAQDGNAGINQATEMVKSYFSSGANLMYAVCAIAGLIGAYKVYHKWNSGHPDVSTFAAAWFGSCVFAALVVTVIKSFFGI